MCVGPPGWQASPSGPLHVEKLEAGAEKYYAPFMPEDAFTALTRSSMWLGSTPGEQGS
jgi:hypothetical protein